MAYSRNYLKVTNYSKKTPKKTKNKTYSIVIYPPLSETINNSYKFENSITSPTGDRWIPVRGLWGHYPLAQ